MATLHMMTLAVMQMPVGSSLDDRSRHTDGVEVGIKPQRIGRRGGSRVVRRYRAQIICTYDDNTNDNAVVSRNNALLSPIHHRRSVNSAPIAVSINRL
jgi:hypothetical protein